MSRLLGALALAAAAAFTTAAPAAAAGSCDHLVPDSYLHVECMNEHRFG
ncbi:hypothetical protein [Actinoalloteichus hymeniacidonis]|uniref:Uncharacterized protein n=1 Tax=Actinoalloteichus hymeniacidonis TaxID=340345 RepID=A0AAC9HR34_9PSEU|nr:hypothetical protein [Actinoalloteichus hymeniacidonis]AOS63773.1 hypothetical protein TL08_14820 [Actinoalloteichus hymeniacidonis]MBB5908173.1 hypothetical protein [Actinoalloteichus hymeniacidonis]